MKTTAIFFAIFFLCRAAAFSLSDAEAKKLFDRSVKSEDPREKAALRIRIANEAPDSAYGLVSKAYLVEHSRDADLNLAASLYTAAIKKDPGLFAAYYNRGLIYSNAGQQAKAMADFNKTIELNPGYMNAYMARGNSYRYSKNYAKALADYNLVLGVAPSDYDTMLNRGVAYSLMKDYHKALADLTTVIEARPGAMAYNNRCSVYVQLKEYEKAVTDCDKALELAPNLDMALINRAKANAGLGRFAEARADRERVAELASEDPEAWYELGTAFYSESKAEEALRCFRRSLALAPDFLHGHYGLCLGYMMSGKYQKVVDTAGYILEKRPTDYFAWLYKAQATAAMGRPKAALGYYAKALASSKDPARTRRARAEVYIDLRDFPKAYEEMRIADQLEGSSTANAFVMARLNYAKGDVKKALIILKNAVTRGPNYARAFRKDMASGVGGYSRKNREDYKALFKLYANSVKPADEEGPVEE